MGIYDTLLQVGRDTTFGMGTADYESQVAARAKMLADAAKARLAGVGPAPSVVAPVANTVTGRMAAQIPTFAPGMRAVGGVLGTAGRFALPVAGAATAVGLEGMGVMDVANDPTTSKIDVATRTAEGVGRLAGAGAGAGLGAAGGSAFGPLGTLAGGVLGGTAGYLAPNAAYAVRDWWQGRTAPAGPGAVSPAASATPVAPATLPSFPYNPNEAVMGAANLARLRAANPDAVSPPPPPRPFTSADFDNGMSIQRTDTQGMGAIRRNGVVTNFGAPMTDAQVAAQNNAPASIYTLHPSQAGYEAARARAAVGEGGPGGAMTSELVQRQELKRSMDAQLDYARSAHDIARQAVAGTPQNSPAYASMYNAALAHAGANNFGTIAEQAATRRMTAADAVAQRREARAATTADLILKQNSPEARKAEVERAMLEARFGAAMKAPDVDTAMSYIGGPAVSDPRFIPDPNSMPDKAGAINLIQSSGRGAGSAIKVVPRPAVQIATSADFAADVKRMGSRDAVLREYAKRNITPPRE